MKIKIILFLLLCGNAFGSDAIDDAKLLAEKGGYKEAYEKLLKVIEEMQKEIVNMEGLVQYYKGELNKITTPQPVVDYSYNESANALWASAWNYQHDGVFKKTGREKEEYLHRAVDTYKRIVIDYPYSNKAEEAQYRIGRVYYKFIKDNKKAEEELQRYLDMYPNGRFASEVKETLMRFKK